MKFPLILQRSKGVNMRLVPRAGAGTGAAAGAGAGSGAGAGAGGPLSRQWTAVQTNVYRRLEVVEAETATSPKARGAVAAAEAGTQRGRRLEVLHALPPNNFLNFLKKSSFEKV